MGREIMFRNLILLVLLVPSGIEVGIKGWGYELIHGPTVLLGGTTGATGTVNKATDAAHLQQFILGGWSDILHHFGHKFGTDAVLYGLQNLEGIGNWGLAHFHYVAWTNHARGFDLNTTHHYTAFLAGIGSYGTRLKNTHGP